MSNISIISTFIAFFLISCNDVSQSEKQIGGFTVKSNFKNDKKNGLTYFYKNGILVSKREYINDKLNGYENDYENNVLIDSMNFQNNILHGKRFQFDLSGDTIVIVNYYYGIKYETTAYTNNKINSYAFTDFDKMLIFNSEYDLLRQHISYSYHLGATISDLYNRVDSAIGVFFYFPKPPTIDLTFKLGTVSQGKKSNEFILNSDRAFIDTSFRLLHGDSSYYLSILGRNNITDSSFSIYYQELNGKKTK